MKIVSLNEKFCSVRILFTNLTLHVTHYRCYKLFIVNKAYCKMVKGLIGCPQSVGKILLMSI